MTNIVQFINHKEDSKDIIVSFAITDPELGVKSLILHRTLVYEEFLDEEERGVKVSMEGDNYVQEEFNMLRGKKSGAKRSSLIQHSESIGWIYHMSHNKRSERR